MRSGDPTLDERGSADALTVPSVARDDTLPATAPRVDGELALPLRDPARYVRIGEIARGGMGRIVAADDQELGRRVAIKELLARSPVLEQRFEREVRITTRLQHPGIIAVQDAGRWPDGNAFYTMQHVEGRAFKDVIAGAVSLDQRIALLPHVIAVADALAYAHGRSVIHRDLKPSNILIGRFGETIVIDWGLAKHLDDAVEPVPSTPGAATGEGVTILGQALGTPAYMPPEQARGERVDTRADVYSIGAILYHVLAHRAPYGDATSDTHPIEHVLAGPPRSLEALVPDAPADLRAIAAKAMDRDAAGRYPSAAELATDLRRFSTGQLVAAHRYSTRQRIARWIARHRAPVGVAVAAAAVLAGVGIVAVQRIREQRDVAAAQRAVAEGHRVELERLLDFLVVDLHAKLEPIGKLDLLELVAERAAAYYASQPAGALPHDAALHRGLAQLHLGDVRVAGGDLPAGLAAYREALAIAERLDEPADVANARDKIGTMLARQGDLAGALAEQRASLAIRERRAAAAPTDGERQRAVARSHSAVGNVLAAQGDLGGALAEYRLGLAVNRALTVREPMNTDYQRNLAVSHNKLGDVLDAQHDFPGAAAEYRAAVAIMETLAARDPANTAHQYRLSASYDNVALVLSEQKDLTGALGAYRASLAIMQRLVDHDPANTEWQEGLSIGQVNVGTTLRDQGDLAGALAAYRAAHTIRVRLAAQDPTNTEWEHDLSVALERIGGVEQQQGDLAAALTAYRDSLAIRQRLADLDPSNATWQRNLWIAQYKIGTIAELRGEVAAARRAYQLALDGAERMVAAHPDDASMRADADEVRTWVERCCHAAR